MRELNLNNQKPVTKNRFKKPRNKVNLRGFMKKVVWIVATVMVISLASFVCHELYGFVGKKSFLRLDRIEVTGNKKLTREEILAAASVRVGDDLLALRISGIGEQLAKNPWVKTVRVRRDFPRSLSIDVSERLPIGIVSMGYLYYLDNKGEVFKPLQKGDSLDFPVITGFSEEDVQRDPAGVKEALKGVLALLEELDSGKKGIPIVFQLGWV